MTQRLDVIVFIAEMFGVNVQICPTVIQKEPDAGTWVGGFNVPAFRFHSRTISSSSRCLLSPVVWSRTKNSPAGSARSFHLQRDSAETLLKPEAGVQQKAIWKGTIEVRRVGPVINADGENENRVCVLTDERSSLSDLYSSILRKGKKKKGRLDIIWFFFSLDALGSACRNP